MNAKLGRPKLENPRNKSLNLRLREDELDLIKECSDKLKLTRTDTIMKGIKKLKKELEK